MENAQEFVDELNVSRLNLIAALDHVTTHSWAVDMEIQGRPVRVECDALPTYGVPHGLDNDVYTSLINAFILSGMPSDGWLTISMPDLRRACKFDLNGHYQHVLFSSLRRMHTSNFTIRRGWRDAQRRWTHASFPILIQLEFSTEGRAGVFDEATMIRVRFADQIVESIRSGYTKPLDVEFMHRLQRPRTRSLYRILDAVRADEGDVFEVTLEEWAKRCKMNTDRMTNVRRALEKSHEELLACGYLRAVNITGRGADQRIRYEFAAQFRPVDPLLLLRLSSHGVASGVARTLLTEHEASWITAQVDRFEALVASKVLTVRKTPAAALVHLLKHPDEYPYPAAAPPKSPRPRAAMEPLLEAPVPDFTEDFAGLDPEQATGRLVTRLGTHYRRLMNLEDMDLLREAVLAGRVNPADIYALAMRAVATMQREVFVQQLRHDLLAART